MAMSKLSVTVDAEVLAEIKRLKGAGVNISLLVNDALRRESKRLLLLEILEEMERENPASADDIAKGERIWNDIVSSTQEHSQPSQPTKKRRASR